jgi:hypothetical protein
VAGATLLGCFVAACGFTEPAPDPCAARVDALAERLARAASFAEPSGAPPDVELPAARGGVALEGAPVLLVLAESEVRLGGRGVGGADVDRAAATLARDLRALMEASSEEGSDASWVVALWIEPTVTLERIARLLEGAPPRVHFALLVRAADVEVTRAASPPAWTREALRVTRDADPFARRERVEEAWVRATEGCEAARAHLPSQASLAPAGLPLGGPSVEPLVRAIRTCGCAAADLDAIEAVTLAALVPASGPVAVLPRRVRFGPALERGEELAIDGDTSASALAARLARLRGEGVLSIVAR